MIGANTAIFSIVNAVLLRPLPFDESDRLVRLFTRTAPTGNRGPSLFALSPGKFYDWQRSAQSFERMAMYRFRDFALTGTGSARAIEAGAVGDGFFEVLRGRPVLGRVFLPEEDRQGNHRVVILSDRFWASEFSRAPGVIGASLKLDDEAYTIVGVMAPEFSIAAWNAVACDIWVPLALTDEQRAVRGNHNQRGVARLKPNVDLARARAEMNTIAARLSREYPQSDHGWGIAVVPMQEEIVSASRTMLILLLGAVGLVLLIACANAGNLLFTRALARRKEIAIRSALGAGRRRVFQQLLIEALLLSGAAGVLGLLFAYTTLTSVAALFVDQVPRADEVSLDVRVLLFVVGVSIVTGVLAGTLPALRAGRADLNDALKEGGRGGGTLGVGTRRVLVVCEVALSLVLLMSGGLMIRSLLALKHGDTGFNPNGVLTMNVSLAPTQYPSPVQRAAFFDNVIKRIRALPGVQAAGTIDFVPLTGGSLQSLTLEGYPEPPQNEQVVVQVRQLTPGYLRAMEIPVLRGRDIVDDDGDVLLVSEQAAKLLWKSDNPIGRRASLPGVSKTVFREVVGIVGDVKQRSLTDVTTPTVYLYSREWLHGAATFVMRTSVPPAALAQPAAAIIRELDPAQPVDAIETMVDILDRRLTSQRFSALLFGLFASGALILASVGIYSVVSYIVRGRRREIAIRTALGARTGDVLRQVILEAMWPTLIGVAVGTVGALAFARLLRGLIYGVSASDPRMLAAAAALLILLSLLASLVPAYRASRFDPVRVLRED